MHHREEMVRVLLFVAAVGGVYAWAFVALARKFLSRPGRPLRWHGRTAVSLAAFGVLCMLYGRFLEPRWVEVTTTLVPTSRLPAGHPGVRIVHLSDIHSDAEPLLEERIPALVAELAPDIVVFTGDAANAPEGVPVFRRCIEAVARVAPTYVVRGNWDVWFFPHIDRFAGTGAIELDLSVATVEVAGVPVRVAGCAHENHAGLGDAIASLPPDGPLVLLHHCPYPDVVPDEVAPRVDLMCAGHVHGGQVALPFYGALLTLSRFGKQYEQGLYPLPAGGQLYVSRGTGMEGGSAPRVRFCARPEIALLRLVPR
jgi:predicted MPP superfamily phosphohydrolase